MWRTFPTTCDWSWQEMKPAGVTRTYLGVDVFEGHYTYRRHEHRPDVGRQHVRGADGAAARPRGGVGAAQLGRQPPAVRPGADRARPRGGAATATGASRRPTTPTAATASTASTRSVSSPTATPPIRSGRSSTTASSGCRPGAPPPTELRAGRRHAARVVPGPGLRPRRGAGQPGQAAPRTSTPTAGAASTTRSTSSPARSRATTSRSTRG